MAVARFFDIELPKPALGLQIQEEGLTVLRRVGAPLHVVFTIGGSRCGKSTVCNALLHGQDAVGRQGFQTGSSFDPVTHGVDVAAKKLPGGGSLVLADCPGEGAFHICGSTMSARGFGSVGLLAYHLSSVVVHVTMGSIDEQLACLTAHVLTAPKAVSRDIEALGHLAATAPETERRARKRKPPNGSPELLLLVNGARFELGTLAFAFEAAWDMPTTDIYSSTSSDAVARRLLQPQPGAGRTCARGAIAAAFRASPFPSERPALEALPCCEHDAYWPKVEELRRRILSVPAVAQGMGKASGSQLAERLERLVAAMSGNTGPATDPVSAAEQAMRSLHLDPLVEEIAKKFTAAASSVREEPGSPSSPGSQCDQDALAVEEESADTYFMRHVGARLAPNSNGGLPLGQEKAVAAVVLEPFALGDELPWLKGFGQLRPPAPPSHPAAHGGVTILAVLVECPDAPIRVESMRPMLCRGRVLTTPGFMARGFGFFLDADFDDATEKDATWTQLIEAFGVHSEVFVGHIDCGNPAFDVGARFGWSRALIRGTMKSEGSVASACKKHEIEPVCDKQPGHIPAVKYYDAPRDSMALVSISEHEAKWFKYKRSLEGDELETFIADRLLPMCDVRTHEKTPTPPQTPSRRRTLAALLGGVETTALRAEALHSSATQQMAQLRAALGKLSQAQALGTESDTDQVTPWQESWQRRLQDLGRRPLSTWHTAGQELVDEIARELREIEGRMPDVVSGAVMLEEARGEVEALRLSRRQALEKTQRRLEQRVEELRQECAQAVGGHAELRERVSRQLSLRMAGLQQTLTDEALHRRERHQALVEVVAQMSKSLEASMLSEEQDTMDTLTPSPAQPQKTTPGSRWKSEKTWAVRRRL
ncbi:unnamed protein product [Effrenium voratum]|uniref:Guanylate-binding protein N-terminal domain-containing protein n=1 Tax=Effrenium voratum TaxID=2562239 RepID=A0AA36JTV7_9DINO|nr:unnamed protein product [Effrenium voratum]